MYCSVPSTENQPFLWGQPTPKQTSPKSEIYCNGKPTKRRDWRSSRETHRNQAEKWAICTNDLLRSLPPDIVILRGCIKYPHRSPAEWKDFKRKFSNLLSRWSKLHGVEVAVIAKQHITDRAADCHLDYLAWTTGTTSTVQTNIRKWAKACGGKATCRIVKRDKIQHCSNYIYKFASTDNRHFDTYWKYHYLPATPFHCTWVLGNFWRRKPTTITCQQYWDGELQTVERKFSGMEQIWKDYLQRLHGNAIPRFTTPQYRAALKVEKLLSSMSKPQPPMTKEDWLLTLGLIVEYPDGLRIGEIYHGGKPTDDWLIESGDDVWIADRLNGKQPKLQRVVTAFEAEQVRRSMSPPPEPHISPPVSPKPEPTPEDLAFTEEMFWAELAAM